MNLEEIRAVFEHGFGVRYAENWRKQRKATAELHNDEEMDLDVV
jgi:SP family myo-inositol transporter-like MFS transporter 13